jgi:hypothetical protein
LANSLDGICIVLLSGAQQTLYRCGSIHEGLFVSFKLLERDPEWDRNRGVGRPRSRIAEAQLEESWWEQALQISDG